MPRHPSSFSFFRHHWSKHDISIKAQSFCKNKFDDSSSHSSIHRHRDLIRKPKSIDMWIFSLRWLNDRNISYLRIRLAKHENPQTVNIIFFNQVNFFLISYFQQPKEKKNPQKAWNLEMSHVVSVWIFFGVTTSFHSHFSLTHLSWIVNQIWRRKQTFL